MKRLFLLIVTIGFFGMQSCSGPEGIPGKNGQDAPLNQVIDIYNLSFTTTNNFSNLITFNQKTYATDVILAFRQNFTKNGTMVWKPLPQTYYFPNGTLNYSYDFDFTQFDVNIFINGNDLGTILLQERTNQTFRLVNVPAEFKNKLAFNTQLSYEEAITKYKIDDSKVTVLNKLNKLKKPLISH